MSIFAGKHNIWNLYAGKYPAYAAYLGKIKVWPDDNSQDSNDGTPGGGNTNPDTGVFITIDWEDQIFNGGLGEQGIVVDITGGQQPRTFQCIPGSTNNRFEMYPGEVISKVTVYIYNNDSDTAERTYNVSCSNYGTKSVVVPSRQTRPVEFSLNRPYSSGSETMVIVGFE